MQKYHYGIASILFYEVKYYYKCQVDFAVQIDTKREPKIPRKDIIYV